MDFPLFDDLSPALVLSFNEGRELLWRAALRCEASVLGFLADFRHCLNLRQRGVEFRNDARRGVRRSEGWSRTQSGSLPSATRNTNQKTLFVSAPTV